MEQEIEDLKERCSQLESVILDMLDTFCHHDIGYTTELVSDLADIRKTFEILIKD